MGDLLIREESFNQEDSFAGWTNQETWQANLLVNSTEERAELFAELAQDKRGEELVQDMFQAMFPEIGCRFINWTELTNSLRGE